MLFFCTTVVADINITVPSGTTGKVYYITHNDPGGELNLVIVNPDSGLIDRVSSISVSSDNTRSIYHNSGNWYTLGGSAYGITPP